MIENNPDIFNEKFRSAKKGDLRPFKFLDPFFLFFQTREVMKMASKTGAFTNGPDSSSTLTIS